MGKYKYLKSKAVEQTPERPPQPFPQNLKKVKEDACFKKLFNTFR